MPREELLKNGKVDSLLDSVVLVGYDYGQPGPEHDITDGERLLNMKYSAI